MQQARPRLEQVVDRSAEVRTPGTRWERVRRLVVVRNDRLGDLVLSIPAVAALKRTYEGAWLGLVVRPALETLAGMVEVVDEILVDRGTTDDLTATLRAFAPDLLVSISPGARAGWAAMRARVPHRLGPGYRIYSPLFERTVEERRRAGRRHELEYALSFAHRAGATGEPARFPFRVSADAEASLQGWLEAHRVGRPYVVLHPGSGGSCPAWPSGHFARLGALLRAEGVTVVFSVGPADEAVSDALDATADARRIPRFSGDLTTLSALLRGASVLVSNSTGPLHLAAALGAPTLAFHAPWATCGAGRWGPYAANGWALVADLAEALSWSRADRRRRSPELLASIPPATALACTLALSEGRAPDLSEGRGSGG